MASRTRPAHVPASRLNEILEAAYARAESLEAKLGRVVEPILHRQGDESARAFRRTVTDHLAASGIALGADGGLRGVSGDSLMVCLKPRPDEADAIADPGGSPPESLHVTLAVLLDAPPDVLRGLLDALRPVAAAYAPLAGRVGGYGEFRPPGCGILLPDVPGLVELRVAVTEALYQADVEYARDHGFQPHLTVDGRPEDDEAEQMLDRVSGAPLHFDAILVVQGDEVVGELPLVGVPAVTAAGEPSTRDVSFALAQFERALREFRQALQTGNPVDIAAARADLNDARDKVGEALAGSATWTAPAGPEMLDIPKLAQQIRARTEPARQALIETTMTPALREAGLSFDVTNPLTQKALASTGKHIQGISDTTRSNVMQVVKSAWENGLSIDHTAKMIALTMQADALARARTIARTELIGAINGGSLAATQLVSSATGSAYEKSWLTAPGAPHPRHELYEGLDGQTVALDEKFDVGGSALSYPGDPDGDAGEVINCRCSMRYVEAGPAGGEFGGETVPPVEPPPPMLETLNPTGGLNVPYGPEARAVAPLGPNITTLDKTMGVSPDAPVTIYRGAPTNQSEIAAGDFVTTNEQLAKDYAGEGNVLSKDVPASHVLDDSTEPLGEEYIYRPPVAASAEKTYSADVGVTPFRAATDDPVGFYESDKYGQFVGDVHDSAASYGVTVDGLDKVTGVWQGETEPSVSLRIHDGEKGVRAYSANLANAYNQDGVLIFGDHAAGDVMATFQSALPQADTTAAMARAGIDGGRFTADGNLQVIGSGPAFVKQLDALAGDLGPYDAAAGRFELLERDAGHYGNAIQAFGKVEPPPDVATVAAGIRTSATLAEPAATAALSTIATDTGGKMVGLEYAVKSTGSLERKITDDLETARLTNPAVTAAQAATNLNDGLRYTMEFDSANYQQGVQTAIKSLGESGYSPVRIRNYWGNEDCKGINAVFKSPTGGTLELQFHTPQSWELKNGALHDVYEKFRVSTDPAERARLWAEMGSLTSTVATPAGALTIGETTTHTL